MDRQLARELIALNNRFYAEHAHSFSQTRGAAWQGWTQVANLLEENLAHAGGNGKGCTAPVRVLDLACGNLRFERFLADALPCDFEFHAVDNCPELASDALGAPKVTFHHRDVLADLFAENPTPAAPESPLRKCPPPMPHFSDDKLFHLSVCFGFMHHVPTFEARAELLHGLVSATSAGGLIALSLWQFMDDTRLARKTTVADAIAAERGVPGFNAPLDEFDGLEADDHFLGWQDDPGPLRYCHHFAESEIDRLVESCGNSVEEAARFSADGASGTLNRYLVLKRR